MKLKRMYVLFALLCVGISTLFISGCEKNKNKITIAEVTHSVFYAPQYVAMSEKIFEKYDLEVELILASGADKVMATLLSKDAEIGLMGPEASIYVYAQGRSDYAITFAQLTQKDGTFIVGREKIEDFTLEALNGKSILGGRRGGMPMMTLEYVLKEEGLNPGVDKADSNVNIRTDIAFAAQAGAFISGEADFTTLFEPTASELEIANKGYVLASVGAYTDNVAYTCYQALKSYMDNNEEKITNFTNAIAESLIWVNNSSAEKIALSIKDFFKETDINVLTKAIQRYKDIEAWSMTPYLDEAEFKHLQNILISSKELDKYMPYSILVQNKYSTKR